MYKCMYVSIYVCPLMPDMFNKTCSLIFWPVIYNVVCAKAVNLFSLVL